VGRSVGRMISRGGILSAWTAGGGLLGTNNTFVRLLFVKYSSASEVQIQSAGPHQFNSAIESFNYNTYMYYKSRSCVPI